MKPSKYLTGDDFESLFFHNGRYWFCEIEGEILVVPAVGDIVEYENGERNIVCFYSSFNEAGDLAVDARMFDEIKVNINRRGRSNQTLSITKEANEGGWPPKGCRIIRDGRVIYPISKYYHVINKTLLLRRSLKLKGLRVYYLFLNKSLNALDRVKASSAYRGGASVLAAVKKGFEKVGRKLSTLPSAAIRLYRHIFSTFSKILDISKSMLKKIKNIFD